MSEVAANHALNDLDGLTVQRRFTTPGVHPFDQVEWEQRDAVIGDPANPAFEQRGVEFPKTGRRTQPTSSPRSTSGEASTHPNGRAPSRR